MNTIKIYFNENGTIDRLVKDFPLYQGAYQNKLLNVFIPTSILQPEIVTHEGNTLVEEYSAGTAMKIGMSFTTQNGQTRTSEPRLMRFLKTLTYQNVEYALYERMLPQEFTLYAGQGANAPILNVSAVVVNFDTDPATIIRVITTQTCALDVMESTSLDADVQEASPFDEVLAEQTAIQQTLIDLDTNKQDKVDNRLAPEDDKNLVSVVNTIYADNQTQQGTINDHTLQITALENAVSALEAEKAGAEIPIGSMRGSTMPTATQLNNEVETQTGDDPTPNNVIIFTLLVEGGTDRTFKFVYVRDNYVNAADAFYPSGLNGWTYYEIPAQEHASNGTYGSIQGTYGIGSTNAVLMNISDGEITNIYYKDPTNNYRIVQEDLNTLRAVQSNIIDGTQIVHEAEYATKDAGNNVINETYAPISDVYTKSQSDAKYLSKTYTNIYYYSADGLVDDVPQTPASGIQFTTEINSNDAILVCNCSRTTTGDYHFTKNSTDSSSIALMTDVDCQLHFILYTYANNVQLSAETTETMTFTANELQRVDITSIYNRMESPEVDVPIGSTFSKRLYVVSDDDAEITLYLYSNTTFPSTYQLNAQSIVLNINTINGLKPVYIQSTDWTDNGNDTYTVVVPQTEHQQPASTRYFLELQKAINATTYQYIAFTPIVDESGDITITANEAIDCVLLIGSNLSTDEKGIITITNPTVAQEIDYNLYGAMKVTQTTQPVALNLLPPTDASKFYAFFITNDTNSTETINWNGEDIAPGSGLQFRWDGAQWIVGEQPTSTTEIYDDGNDQLLSTTITQLENGISTNANNITTLQNTKQNTLTFDPAPTDTSTNPVTSGGVYTALSSKEDTTNKVTSMSNSSTNTQYPGAKCVYDAINNRNPSTTINATWTTSSSTINQILNVGGVTTMNTLTLASAYTFTAGHFYTIQIQAVTQFGNVTVSQANGIYTAPFNVQGQPFLGVDADNVNPSSFCTMSFSGTTFKIACGRNIKSGYTENFKVIIKDYA